VAKEDFCFTYYDGDAARDKAHMTRLQRGAYDDIISAQRKRGHLSLDDVKRVLSGDFDACWPALEWVLKNDEAGKFFIEWVDKSIEKMRKHSEKQKEKINARWKKIPEPYQNDTAVLPQNNHGIDPVIPLEYGYGDGNVFELIKNEIGVLILKNEEQRISANELADHFSNWLSRLSIKNEREYFVRNEGDRNDRFDLMVFDVNDNPTLIIEVKNYVNHDDYYKPLRQIERYSKHNLPILFLPNFRTAYDRLISCYKFMCSGEYDNSFVFIPGAQPSGIIPEMVKIFKDEFPKYYSMQQNDFPAAREIAEKVLEWEGLHGDITDTSNSEMIKIRWGEVVKHVAAHNHYRDYDLTKINKYFQSIVQSFNNGITSTNIGGFTSRPEKPGTSKARMQRTDDW
jgi:hypothetical protein